MSHCFVLDVGKTHVKAHVLDAALDSVALREFPNRVVEAGPYPHADVDAIWDQLVAALREFNTAYPLSHICVATHGATAALIDRGRSGNGLVLPVPDYEYAGVGADDEQYRLLRPAFAETASPDLPAGLNLGRQLHWQARRFPEAFATATDILMYPQYWAWRLTGNRYSEVTSLGCHTDLWAPWAGGYSSLVEAMQWQQLFPPLASAWDVAGTLAPELAAATGVAAQCRVHVGVHDSNASYLLFRRALPVQSFSVVSTGTWCIVMESGAGRVQLKEDRDMLANVDVFGSPVICSRFMGGREYSTVCDALGGDPDAPCAEEDVAALVADGVFCLPGWQRGTGPFSGCEPAILGDTGGITAPAALASLYCALVIDYQLDLVASAGEIILSGAFLKNPLLCRLLAQLRAPQVINSSSDVTGTVTGTAELCRWQQPAVVPARQPIPPTSMPRLDGYRREWRAIIARGGTRRGAPPQAN